MADEIIQGTQPIVSQGAEVSAPVTPVIAPVEVVAPVIEPVVTAEVKPAEVSLLGIETKAPEAEVKPVEADKKTTVPEIKPTDTKPVEEAKKIEGNQSEEPAQLPTYEAFTLPEGVTLENERLSDFTKTLAEFETNTKADHAEVQKLGQQLVDRYVTDVTKTIERYNENVMNQWEKQKNEWKDSFIADPEIGGNRQETTLNSAKEFIRTHGGTSEQQSEFLKLMGSTGVGNHPAMIRMLANAMNANREGKPLPATKPMPEQRSKVVSRYGNTN